MSAILQTAKHRCHDPANKQRVKESPTKISAILQTAKATAFPKPYIMKYAAAAAAAAAAAGAGAAAAAVAAAADAAAAAAADAPAAAAVLPLLEQIVKALA